MSNYLVKSDTIRKNLQVLSFSNNNLSNIDITNALKNGNGMSYADFGNLLAKYDIKFEDYMT